MRIAGLRALRDARAAAGRDMPPFQHVAFEELLAGVQDDLRARQPRLDQVERQHILQLIAIAIGAAALVGAEPAEQTRGVDLIRQPCVDETIEVGAVGLDLDDRKTIAPVRACLGKLPLRKVDAEFGRGVERGLSVAAHAEREGEARGLAGRQVRCPRRKRRPACRRRGGRDRLRQRRPWRGR